MHLITGAFVCALASAAHISVEVGAGGARVNEYSADAASQDDTQSGKMVRRTGISKHTHGKTSFQALADTAKAQLGEDYHDNQAVVDETKPGVHFDPVDEAFRMTEYILKDDMEKIGYDAGNLISASPVVIMEKTESVKEWCEVCNVQGLLQTKEGGQLERSEILPKSIRTISTKTLPKSTRTDSTNGDSPPEVDHTSESGGNCVNPDEPSQQYCVECFELAVSKCEEAATQLLNPVTKDDERNLAVSACAIDLACNEESVCWTWKCANCVGAKGCDNSLVDNETQQAAMPDSLEQEKEDALAGLAERTRDAADAIGNGLDSSLDGKCN